MKHYLVTLKANPIENPYVDDYMNVISMILGKIKQSVIVDNCFELDNQKKKLHWHGLIACKYAHWGPISTIISNQGWHFHYALISSVAEVKAVKAYINKSKLSRESVDNHYFTKEMKDTVDFYSKQYGFI